MQNGEGPARETLIVHSSQCPRPPHPSARARATPEINFEGDAAKASALVEAEIAALRGRGRPKSDSCRGE